MSLEIENLYTVFKKCPRISTDSRNIVKDSIFFALKGTHFDGNTFAEKALDNGAAFIVIDNPNYYKNERCLLVNDALITLQQLALEHRKHLNIPVLGITGSNGKTTTKELIACVLGTQFNCLATKGNLNNHIGVPLTILSVTPDTQIAVVEMGANHIGEIQELCDIALPDYGIITNIGKAHLEGFKNIENIIHTKAALYRSVEKNGRSVFVNADDDLLLKLSAHQKRTTYSLTNEGETKVQIADTDPYLSLVWNNFMLKTHLFGVYNIYNVLAAISVGKFFKISDNNIVKAISSYTPVNNRSQIIKTNCNTIIMDAYNANPTSMDAAIKSFLEIKEGEKVLILGDMLELGNDSEQEHKKIVELLVKGGVKEVLLVGEVFSYVGKGIFNAFSNNEELKQYLESNKFQGKTILVKGSRGIKLENILPVL